MEGRVPGQANLRTKIFVLRVTTQVLKNESFDRGVVSEWTQWVKTAGPFNIHLVS